MIKNSANQFGSFSKTLHWLMAILVIALLILGFVMENTRPPTSWQLYTIHKSMGLTVLGLLVIRIIWHLYSKLPELAIHLPLHEKILARSVQFLFYITLLVQTLSGWIMAVASHHVPHFWGLFAANLPIDRSAELAYATDQMHSICAWVLIGLITLHMLGALKHHFMDQDNTLSRMLLRF